ncbi:MAG: hypothetical protein AB7I09_20585 [Planctomycetota bacterium]
MQQITEADIDDQLARMENDAKYAEKLKHGTPATTVDGGKGVGYREWKSDKGGIKTRCNKNFHAGLGVVDKKMGKMGKALGRCG